LAINSVVFAFGHRARSGKDTAANEIIKQRGLTTVDAVLDKTTERYDIRKYGFADALKIEVTNLARKAGGMEKLFAPDYCFPKKGYVVTLPEWVKYDPNPDMSDPLCPLGKQRALLQWYGSDYRRTDDDLYWIRQLEQTIELEKPQIAILSDLRFPNEMEWTLQYGEAVRVDRAGLPPSTHVSEIALADSTDWSLILENNRSLEEFLLGAVTAFDELLLNFPQQRNVRQALGII
jgi:hypothetical protein